MDDPEKKGQNITMAELNPKILLKSPIPGLIDEWQIVPKLWDAIRFKADHQGDVNIVGKGNISTQKNNRFDIILLY